MALFPSVSQGTTHPHPLVCIFLKGKENQEGKTEDRLGTYCRSPPAQPTSSCPCWSTHLMSFSNLHSAIPSVEQGVPGGSRAPFHNQGQLSRAIAPSVHLPHCPLLLVPSPPPRGRCGKLGLKIKNSRQQLQSQREGKFILRIKVPHQIITLNAQKS